MMITIIIDYCVSFTFSRHVANMQYEMAQFEIESHSPLSIELQIGYSVDKMNA